MREGCFWIDNYTTYAPWLKRSGQGYETHNSLASWTLYPLNEVGRLLATPIQDLASVINNHIKRLYRSLTEWAIKDVPLFLDLYKGRIPHHPPKNKEIQMV